MGVHKPNSGSFVKGDKRINRKGRPKSFDELRALAKNISHEKAVDANGNPIINPQTGAPMTQAELILRSLSGNKNSQWRNKFLEIAYGKVPDELDLKTGPIEITVKYAEEDGNNTSETT